MPPSPIAIEMGGLGTLEVSAGRNVDLSTTSGIVTVGNQRNPYLPDKMVPASR